MLKTYTLMEKQHQRSLLLQKVEKVQNVMVNIKKEAMVAQEVETKDMKEQQTAEAEQIQALGKEQQQENLEKVKENYMHPEVVEFLKKMVSLTLVMVVAVEDMLILKVKKLEAVEMVDLV